jgi:hypothetical protein
MCTCLSHTFEKINSKAEKYWKFKRYKVLIDEYQERSILPPPLILISYLIKLFIFIIICRFNDQKYD